MILESIVKHTIPALNKYFKKEAKQILDKLLSNRVVEPEEAIRHAVLDTNKATLYIHIPFCIEPCKFCCFVRFKYNQERYIEYMKSLRIEVENYIKMAGDKINSVYIGGGTPTINREGILELLDFIKSGLRNVDVSLEAHPATIDRGFAKELGSRVSRISIGIQSFNQEILNILGRKTHTPKQALEALESVKGLFETINADLISSVPNQNPMDVVKDAVWLLERYCDEVTIYPLLVAWGSEKYWSTSLDKVDFEHQTVIFKEMMKRNIRFVTPWCYSRVKPRLIDEYFIETTDYFGAGLSSIGKCGSTIYMNTLSLDKYSKLVKSRGFSAQASIKLSESEEAGYKALIEAFSLKIRREIIDELSKHYKYAVKLLKSLLEFEDNFYKPRGIIAYYAIHKVMKTFLEGIAWLRIEALRMGI